MDVEDGSVLGGEVRRVSVTFFGTGMESKKKPREALRKPRREMASGAWGGGIDIKGARMAQRSESRRMLDMLGM